MFEMFAVQIGTTVSKVGVLTNLQPNREERLPLKTELSTGALTTLDHLYASGDKCTTGLCAAVLTESQTNS